MTTIDQRSIEKISFITPQDAIEFGSNGLRSTYPGERDFYHPLRVTEILKDFCGEYLPPVAYVASLYHDSADRLQSKHSATANSTKEMLQNSLGLMREEDRNYVACLISDMGVVEESAESYRRHLDKPGDVIDPGSWMSDSTMSDPGEMLNLLQNVNLESVLIKAAELLDNLNYPPNKQQSVFQDVNEAESFYAPLCEVLGFDGFAMALRDRAAVIRLEKSGNEEFLQKAQEIRAHLGRVGLHKIVDYLHPGDSEIVEAVKRDSGAHDVYIGDAVTHIDEDTVIASAWRVKSIASIAMKLLRQDGIPPADVLGTTIIVDDAREAPIVFAGLVRLLQQHNDSQDSKVSFATAHSKEKPVSIRGTQEYKNRFMQELGMSEEEVDIDPKEYDDEAFMVAKVTFVVDGVPVETQIATKADREKNRIGSAAHILYKSINKNLGMAALKKIYDRKRMLNPEQKLTNGQSKKGGAELLELLGLSQVD